MLMNWLEEESLIYYIYLYNREWHKFTFVDLK